MTDEIKKKRGRPKGSKAEHTAYKQLTTYKQASEREDMNFSAWIRNKLDKASK